MNRIIKNGGMPRAAGYALFVALMVVVAVSAAIGLFFRVASEHGRTARRWHESDQCLLDAQSALERVKYELVQAYLSNQVSGAGSLSWFNSWDTRALGSNPVYAVPAMDPVNGSEVVVTIANVSVATNALHAEVVLVGAAGRSAPFSITRMIGETMRVTPGGGDSAQPLDYAYLLDGSGTLRNNMVINGDIRINGDYNLNNSSSVNGNRYASGKFTKNSPQLSLSAYWNAAPAAARPTDPTGANNIDWPMGYSPDKTKNTYQARYPMPLVGEMPALAASAAGRISQNGADLAVNVYSGHGPDKIAGTADDGCLVLDGSKSPLTIQGSVVVMGDLIIRGKVGGQGTIYAGRNVHIVGDLSYVAPPAWPKPDTDPAKTAAANAGKDLLILAAKGNVVVGNYTSSAWSNRVWGLMANSAVPREVSASDAAIGYDSDNNPANGFLFDGRYNASEANGGRRLGGAGTNTVPRRYYESSLADSAFSALCDADNVPGINAAVFCNHGFIGNLGSSAAGGNSVLNGAMACRDELDAFYGTFTINWDIRLGSRSRERVNTYFLSASGGTGGDAAKASTIGWREIY